MPNVSPVPTGPQTGNRFGTQEAAQGIKTVVDQMNLNSTIQRVQNIRAAYKAIPEQGKQVAQTFHERGAMMASTGSERADQLRSIMDKTIGGVQEDTSQDMADKTALVQAVNQVGGGGGGGSSIETGKGTQVNSKT